MLIVGLIALFFLPMLVVSWANGLPISLIFFDSDISHTIGGLSPYAMSLAMLAGVIFGSSYTALRERPDDNPWASIKNSFRSPHFYKALLASPIVFSGVYAIARTNPDPVIALAFCFQNGFFCESVLQTRKKELDIN